MRAVIAKLLLPRVSGGRMPAYEVLINNPAISTLIRENKINQIKTVLQTSARHGMITMANAMQSLVQKGEISQSVYQEYLLDEPSIE